MPAVSSTFSRHPGPLAELTLHLHASRPKIRDLEMCVDFGAVEKCVVVCGSVL